MEKPINIALIFDQEVSSGGGYQQGLNAAMVALKVSPELAKISIFHTKKNIKNKLIANGIDSQLINISMIKKLYLYIKTTAKFRFIYIFLKLIFDFNFFESFLEKEDIDLVYFISPSRFALDLEKINFIFTIWDLCHRDHFEFPEVKLKGEYETEFGEQWSPVHKEAKAFTFDLQADLRAEAEGDDKEGVMTLEVLFARLFLVLLWELEGRCCRC